MSKIKYSFFILLVIFAIVGCSKDDDEVVVVPLKPYAEQFVIDSTNIELFLKTNYITVDADYNVTYAKIPEGGTQTPIWDYQNNTGFPKLLYRDVHLHDLHYKLYYLVIREGVGERPTNVDGVLTAYNGKYISTTTTDNVTTQTTTQFEEVLFPSAFFDLYGDVYVRGWKEVFPQFKAGTYTSNADGTVSYDNYGVGVMFIPSALAYYSGSGTIPAYTPLVFSFKLFAIQRLDHEFTVSGNAAIPNPDGILSMYEDLDGDGYMWTASELNSTTDVNPDDTDGDGIPDFLDSDDDGDNYTTKLEITNPATGKPYPFNEIPTCESGKKNYLDKTCHP